MVPITEGLVKLSAFKDLSTKGIEAVSSNSTAMVSGAY